jgi:tRNA threonylcarbamoyladenosine biosynthesis protein TsaB
MPLLLLIDTTTTLCSVALTKGTKLLATRQHDGDFKHAEMLTTFIHECCTEANVKLNLINAVVVSKGPGSYTGLRIGVSTAKGIAYALNKPLIAVNTLHAMAYTTSKTITDVNYTVCAMIDARRMEVYDIVLDNNANVIKETSAQIVVADSYNQFLSNPFYYCGDGAAKCEDLLKGHKNAHYIPNIKTYASNMLALALQKYSTESFENVAYFEPFYLKDFIAGKPKAIKP